MELQKITCGGCGASLSLSGEPKFVDCRFCGASLRVVRNESAVFTEVQERVEALGDEVAELRKDADLRALEDRWAATQRELSGYDRRGRLMRPTRGFAVFIMAACLLCGIPGIVSAIITQRNVFAPLGFTFFVLMFGVVRGGGTWRQATRYEEAERAYLEERRALMQLEGE
ncbi:MAG: hypothetical protein BGO98_27620 [Myxococcales bacterium 68-20]|nr:MAG: hypothetical protein BGO98_27620 [Myxococcales bacterium 68-20]